LRAHGIALRAACKNASFRGVRKPSSLRSSAPRRPRLCRIGSRSHGFDDAGFELADAALIALIEGPLLDAFSSHRADLDQKPHVLGHGRLADPEFLRNQNPANAVFNQIAVNLLAKMGTRVLKPLEDL